MTRQPKERPMIYSTPMITSIVKDRKQMTRRTLGLELVNERPDTWMLEESGFDYTHGRTYTDYGATFVKKRVKKRERTFIKCPYGQPGDILYARETFFDVEPYRSAPLFQDSGRYLFKADKPFIGEHKFKPSIHMPKRAARVWMEITGIKAERLQAIPDEDAVLEGVEFGECATGEGFWKCYMIDLFCYDNPRTSFQTLWEKINGEESWKFNPWVWVISFKVLSKLGRPYTIPSGFRPERLKSTPSGNSPKARAKKPSLLPGRGVVNALPTE